MLGITKATIVGLVITVIAVVVAIVWVVPVVQNATKKS